MSKTYLVPSDFSHGSERALDYALTHLPRPRGLFICIAARLYPYALAQSAQSRRPRHQAHGERILGIGDQGAGGLGIPIGKLSLHAPRRNSPERTLPIVLDAGSNNEERLRDPEYLGWRHERVTGQAYFDFIDQFVQAVKQELPQTCLQWEDFATSEGRCNHLPSPWSSPRSGGRSHCKDVGYILPGSERSLFTLEVALLFFSIFSHIFFTFASFYFFIYYFYLFYFCFFAFYLICLNLLIFLNFLVFS